MNSDVLAAPNRKYIESRPRGAYIHLPPMSAVRTFPALITPKVAEAIESAIESNLVGSQN